MSKWMHITGIMRVDAIDHDAALEELRRELGQPLSEYGIAVMDYTDGAGFDAALKYRIDYVGAAGPNWITLHCAIVTVWADLEDTVRPEAVFAWAERLLKMKFSAPRDFVISIDAEAAGKWLIVFANGELAMRTIQTMEEM